ncbi:hypothetical protein [Pseudomonas sp. GW101-3H06]|nr:hypothetical protein [Pseudomonas sp. GW101-3H06]
MLAPKQIDPQHLRPGLPGTVAQDYFSFATMATATALADCGF